jgi:hypothetical protein
MSVERDIAGAELKEMMDMVEFLRKFSGGLDEVLQMDSSKKFRKSRAILSLNEAFQRKNKKQIEGKRKKKAIEERDVEKVIRQEETIGMGDLGRELLKCVEKTKTEIDKTDLSYPSQLLGIGITETQWDGLRSKEDKLFLLDIFDASLLEAIDKSPYTVSVRLRGKDFQLRCPGRGLITIKRKGEAKPPHRWQEPSISSRGSSFSIMPWFRSDYIRSVIQQRVHMPEFIMRYKINIFGGERGGAVPRVFLSDDNIFPPKGFYREKDIEKRRFRGGYFQLPDGKYFMGYNKENGNLIQLDVWNVSEMRKEILSLELSEDNTSLTIGGDFVLRKLTSEEKKNKIQQEKDRGVAAEKEAEDFETMAADVLRSVAEEANRRIQETSSVTKIIAINIDPNSMLEVKSVDRSISVDVSGLSEVSEASFVLVYSIDGIEREPIPLGQALKTGEHLGGYFSKEVFQRQIGKNGGQVMANEVLKDMGLMPPTDLRHFLREQKTEMRRAENYFGIMFKGENVYFPNAPDGRGYYKYIHWCSGVCSPGNSEDDKHEYEDKRWYVFGLDISEIQNMSISFSSDGKEMAIVVTYIPGSGGITGTYLISSPAEALPSEKKDIFMENQEAFSDGKLETGIVKLERVYNKTLFGKFLRTNDEKSNALFDSFVSLLFEEDKKEEILKNKENISYLLVKSDGTVTLGLSDGLSSEQLGTMWTLIGSFPSFHALWTGNNSFSFSDVPDKVDTFVVNRNDYGKTGTRTSTCSIYSINTKRITGQEIQIHDASKKGNYGVNKGVLEKKKEK